MVQDPAVIVQTITTGSRTGGVAPSQIKKKMKKICSSCCFVRGCRCSDAAPPLHRVLALRALPGSGLEQRQIQNSFVHSQIQINGS